MRADVRSILESSQQLELLERERQTVADERFRCIRDMKVQMRSSAVAGETEPADRLTATDSLACAHGDAAGEQMLVEDKAAIGELEGDVVARRLVQRVCCVLGYAR